MRLLNHFQWINPLSEGGSGKTKKKTHNILGQANGLLLCSRVGLEYVMLSSICRKGYNKNYRNLLLYPIFGQEI